MARFAAETPVALAVVADGEGAAAAGKGLLAVAERVTAALAERNLLAKSYEAEALSASGSGSQQRFATLKAASGDTRLWVLVEARVVFYEVLQGRYRWVVTAKVLAGRRDEAGVPPSQADLEVPVFLLYHHEREAEALAAAAGALADKVGRLVDGLLAAPGGTAR